MSSHHNWVDEVIAKHALEKPFAPENGKPLKFKVGEQVTYMNPAGVVFSRLVTGLYRPCAPCSLYARGARYLINSDAPWFPVPEASLQPV